MIFLLAGIHPGFVYDLEIHWLKRLCFLHNLKPALLHCYLFRLHACNKRGIIITSSFRSPVILSVSTMDDSNWRFILVNGVIDDWGDGRDAGAGSSMPPSPKATSESVSGWDGGQSEECKNNLDKRETRERKIARNEIKNETMDKRN